MNVRSFTKVLSTGLKKVPVRKMGIVEEQFFKKTGAKPVDIRAAEYINSSEFFKKNIQSIDLSKLKEEIAKKLQLLKK